MDDIVWKHIQNIVHLLYPFFLLTLIVHLSKDGRKSKIKKKEVLVCTNSFERGGKTYLCEAPLLPENEFCSVCFPSKHKTRNRQLDVEKKRKIADEKKKQVAEARRLEVYYNQIIFNTNCFL